jgi:hypothetical protein
MSRGVKLKRAHQRFCASETPTAAGKLKQSKLLGAKVSAWVFSDPHSGKGTIVTLNRNHEKRCVSERMDPYTLH